MRAGDFAEFATVLFGITLAITLGLFFWARRWSRAKKNTGVLVAILLLGVLSLLCTLCSAAVSLDEWSSKLKRSQNREPVVAPTPQPSR